MPKIKVTGFIDVDNLDPVLDYDPNDAMGLSEQAYLEYTRALSSLGLEDVDFALEED